MLATWTNIPSDSLLLVGTSIYNESTCSNMYDTIESQVTSLERNRYGTYSDGAIVTLDSFKTKLQSSNAPFIGIDNFFYTANDVGYSPSTGFNASIFQQALETYCSGTVASNPNAQNVCPNGNFMNTYLFGTTGLFSGGSLAVFAGVLNPSNPQGVTVLTWTRGYLLLKYSQA